MSTWWPPPSFEPSGQVLGVPGVTEPERRETMVQLALWTIGFGPGEQRYRDLCWPGETLAKQRAYEASMSACALVVGGLQRCAGEEHKLLDPPYVAGSAMGRIQQVARDRGALSPADSHADAGDQVIIGTDVPKDHPRRAQLLAEWGSPGHVLTIVELEVDADGITWWHSVDGGRGRITTSRRLVDNRGGKLWLVNPKAGEVKGRRVYSVIRTGQLHYTREWCQPA